MYERVTAEDFIAEREQRPSAEFDVIATAVEPVGVRFRGVDNGRLLFERINPETPNDPALAQRVVDSILATVNEVPALGETLAAVQAIAIR